MILEQFILDQRKTLKADESKVTLHTLEKGYFITIVDKRFESLLALTETELSELFKILERKYNGIN